MSPINCKYFCIGLTFINNLDHKRMCHEIWEFLVSNRRCGDWEGGNNEIFVQPATSLTLFQGACRFCERLGVCLVYHFAKGVLKVTIFINVFKNRTRLFRMTFGIWSRDGYMYSVDRGTWPFFTKKKASIYFYSNFLAQPVDLVRLCADASSNHWDVLKFYPRVCA